MLELGDRFKMLVAYFLGIFYPVVRVTLKIFRNAVCVRFNFVFCHLLRKRVCIHS